MTVKSLCEMSMSVVFMKGSDPEKEVARSLHGGLKYQRDLRETDIRTLFMEVFSRTYPDGQFDFHSALGRLKADDVANIECVGDERAVVFLANKCFFDTGPEMLGDKKFVLRMCSLDLLDTIEAKMKGMYVTCDDGMRKMYSYGEDDYAEYLGNRASSIRAAYPLFASERAARLQQQGEG